MRYARLLLWAGLVVLAAGPAVWASVSPAAVLRQAGVSAPRAHRLVHEAHAAGIGVATIERWARRLSGLHHEQLPVSLAVDQIFEGLVKGVPAARITHGLRVFARDLQGARRTLDRHATPGSVGGHPRAVRHALSDLVIARRAGLDGGALDRLLGRRRLTVSRLSAYVQVATDLRGWGVGRGDVVRALGEARRKGISRHRLLMLDRALARKAAAGQGPRDLGGMLRDGLGLRSPMGPGSLSGPGGAIGMPGPGGAMMGPGPGPATGPGGMTGPGTGMTGPGGAAMGRP